MTFVDALSRCSVLHVSVWLKLGLPVSVASLVIVRCMVTHSLTRNTHVVSLVFSFSYHQTLLITIPFSRSHLLCLLLGPGGILTNDYWPTFPGQEIIWALGFIVYGSMFLLAFHFEIFLSLS
jgi:hypothetical protein